MHSTQWKTWPLYVWLIAAYPVLFLFSQNIGEVYQTEVIASLIAALVAATLLFALIGMLLRDAARAGAITALVTLAFFSYGHIHNLLAPLGVSDWVLAPLYALILVGGVFLTVRAKHSPALLRAAPAANLMAALMVAMTLPPLIGYFYRGLARQIQTSNGESRADHPILLNSAQRPDIYYIILDGYSSNEHLMRGWGYDNSAFTEALEARGFTVAYESKTTYGVTLPSMAASLNMRYLDASDRTAASGAASDEDYLRGLIADNEAAKQLQARGYRYVFMLSGFVIPSTIADVNIDFHPGGPVYYPAADAESGGTHDASSFYQRPFLPVLFQTSMLRGFADEVEETPLVEDQPYKFWKPERAIMTWDEAEKIPSLPEATFTVVHLIKPHEPIAFDRAGSIIPYPYVQYNNPPEVVEQAFFDQLDYVNARTLQMIDTILAESSVPPIIILQGDHGSDLGRPESPDGRRTNFEILNAYYFPRRQCAGLTQDIIPINSFRVLFNCAFGGDYALLPPQFFATPYDYDNIFFFVPVDIARWEAQHTSRPQ